MFGYLSKKKREEILKRIVVCQIIAFEYIKDPEAYTKITENLAFVSFDVGGVKGCTKVQNIFSNYVLSKSYEEKKND